MRGPERERGWSDRVGGHGGGPCRELAERLPYKRLHEIWKETDRMESRLLSNVNYELALELLFMAMKG